MQSEIHLDALPYIDQGYDEPGVREAAMQLVEEETRRYRPTKNYLEFLQPPKTTFETPLLRVEFERLAARRPMETLSMKRYELPQPGTAQKNDVSAWQESVENSMAQLEHQAGRIINLELLSQYSPNEYRLHNTVLSQMVDQKQKDLKTVRNKIQEVNWQRKTEQTTAGGQLQDLSNHWNTLVQRNYEIEKACMEVSQELATISEQAKLCRPRGVVMSMGEPAAKRLCTVAAGTVRRIAVEGNIAAGKSTFLRILEEANPSYSVVSEPLTRWLSIPTENEEVTSSQVHGGNLLDLFYKDPKRWAYSFQTYACVSRLRAQLKPVSQEILKSSRNPVLFYERSVWSDRFVFAYNCHMSGVISETEWHMYCDWHSFLTDTLPVQFDGIIYLRTDPKICYGRLQKRNRPEESSVEQKYLEALHDRHEQWLFDKSLKIPAQLERVPILTLDCDPEFEGDSSRAEELLKQVEEFVTHKDSQ